MCDAAIKFGKCEGKVASSLPFEYPAYVRWMLREKDPTDPLAGLVDDVKEEIKKFDALPFVAKCRQHGCTKTATHVTYPYTGDSSWWCDDHDPFAAPDAKASSGIRSYMDVARYADEFWCTEKESMVRMIQALAEAKGLSPNPVTPEAFVAME